MDIIECIKICDVRDSNIGQLDIDHIFGAGSETKIYKKRVYPRLYTVRGCIKCFKYKTIIFKNLLCSSCQNTLTCNYRLYEHEIGKIYIKDDQVNIISNYGYTEITDITPYYKNRIYHIYDKDNRRCYSDSKCYTLDLTTRCIKCHESWKIFNYKMNIPFMLFIKSGIIIDDIMSVICSYYSRIFISTHLL